jgi:septation ring formation regulator EzrA
MSEESAKSPADHLTDTLAQLKEMRHYSKSNVEHLTASWILFEGELKDLKQTAKIEELMNRQSEFYDALESTIEALDSQLKAMSEEQSGDEGNPDQATQSSK